jgi:predicted nuclease of predicted toxin-antitoxin system
VRLLLDAHLSDRRVGDPLRADGHDVASAQPPSPLAALDDVELLRAATRDTRILVTADVKDFAPIARDFGSRAELHAGLVLLVGVRHGDIGSTLVAIRAALGDNPDEAGWVGRVTMSSRRR